MAAPLNRTQSTLLKPVATRAKTTAAATVARDKIPPNTTEPTPPKPQLKKHKGDEAASTEGNAPKRLKSQSASSSATTSSASASASSSASATSASSSSSAATKEVELKVKVKKEVFEALQTTLNRMAKLKEKIEQRDQYVDHPSESFYDKASKYNGINLRVRKCEGQNSVCMKINKKGATENSFHREEIQIGVDNPDKMLALLHNLGCKDSLLLVKTRIVYLHGDYEIVLDDIPNVGYMVEIEMQKPVDDVTECINEMERFLRESLQVTQYEKEMAGVEKYSAPAKK